MRVDPLLDGWTRLRVCREDVTVGVLLVDHANAQVCHVFVVRGSQVSAVELESPVMVLTWMQQQAAQAA